MAVRHFFRFITIYLTIFIFIHFATYFLIRNQQRYFSQASLDKLIYTISPLRKVATDPCQHAFANDPYSQNYYKISISCSNKITTTNTLDLDAIADKTVGGVIAEYSRIINFDPSQITNCFSTQTGEYQQPNSPIIPRDTLKCYYNQQPPSEK